MVCCVIAVPLPALAASFNFSYVFASGRALQGTFDGEVAADGDRILSLSNVMATYDDSLVALTSDTGGTASFSGDWLYFSGSGSSAPGSTLSFSFRMSKSNVDGPIASVQSCGKVTCTTLDRDRPIVRSRWSATLTRSPAVPEPTAFALFGVGSLIMGGALAAARRQSRETTA
jgi:hypothetical protein